VPTGQWFVDNVGTRWFFDSGALSLDFGYTGDYGYGNPAWERLHRPGDLTAWLTERYGTLAAPATRAEFAAALRLRSAISAVARSLADDGPPDPVDIDIINDLAAGTDIAPTLAGGRLKPRRPSVARAVSTIARDAVAVFSAGAGRVRHCGADNCALIFLDSSRPNARRWCSMRRCGNRTKVRIHRSRIKEAAP
jgi:predicted RNA-binding Zn ribbon-like protein